MTTLNGHDVPSLFVPDIVWNSPHVSYDRRLEQKDCFMTAVWNLIGTTNPLPDICVSVCLYLSQFVSRSN